MVREKSRAALQNSPFRALRYVLAGGSSYFLRDKKTASKELCIALGLPWRRLCAGTHGSPSPATCMSCSGHSAVKIAAAEKRAREKSSNRF